MEQSSIEDYRLIDNVQVNQVLEEKLFYKDPRGMHDGFHELKNETTIHIYCEVTIASSSLLHGRKICVTNILPMTMKATQRT